MHVTPLAGVWIEILKEDISTKITKSLPLRECGLKYTEECRKVYNIIVTPLAGVWIEIFTGAVTATSLTSLPLRECGLKCRIHSLYNLLAVRHSPCGSVD